MNTSTIDLAVFDELKEAAGADFVGELVGTFLEEAPTILAELRRSQAEGADPRFRRAAHSLKTNALTFGATALGDRARALELGGLPADSALLDALEAAYADAAAALEALRHG
jgi:HPt (histidine-containing phosphotransfer) domain-containing protein